MDSFECIWALLSPQGEFKRRRQACKQLWDGFDIEKQRQIYRTITAKKAHDEFVNPNPYFAIEDNAQTEVKQLSFKEYYARFGTTQEQGGWKRHFLPEKRTTIYIKN